MSFLFSDGVLEAFEAKRKPGVRLTGGWRCNAGSGHLMVAKHVPQNQGLVTVAKRQTAGRSGARPALFGLVSGRGVLGAIVAVLVAGTAPAFAAEPLPILPRTDWGAKAPSLQMSPQVPTHVTFHHSAAKQRPGKSTAAKMLSLQRFSQSREKLADGRTKTAWADVPYHFYIAADGSVAEGRDVSFAGDTNTNYDPAGHIAIVLEGNFENELPGEAQIDAAIRLGQLMMAAYGIAPDNLGYHKHHAGTLCPGENFVEVWPLVRERILAPGG